MPDFIPPGDDEFNDFFNALVAYHTANPTALGLTPAEITGIAGAEATWTARWAAWQAEQNSYKSLLEAKNQARGFAEGVLRQINGTVQANPAISDSVKAAAGLPIHKTTRTAAPVPDTHPVLYRVDNEHLLQRLWFSDQNTPGSKAKPKGVALCEIRQVLVAAGGAAPVDPDAMTLLALDSSSPHRTDLEAGDVGRTAYYCQRWVNTTMQPGPWGPITSYIVT